MNWLQERTSIFQNCRDIKGRPGTHEEVLFWGFEKNLPGIIALRKLEMNSPDYKEKKDQIKSTLMGYTPAALLATREKNNIIIVERSGLMQLDFDHADIKQYDLEELKHAVFELPFIAFCGLSCTGTGFYALAAIGEPDRLKEYASHCFSIFKNYGIRLDVSKGGNVADLRYLSYDCNMLIREDPETLHIPKAKPPQPQKKKYSSNGFNPYEHAMRTAETKYGPFREGNRHNFILSLCRSLYRLNVSQPDAEQWINSNLISLTNIKSNCITAAFA